MADYSIEGNRTASATLGVWDWLSDVTRPRKLQLMEWNFGSEASPADNAFLWQILRVTAIGAQAGGAVTPVSLGDAEAATESDTLENLSTNPTVGSVLLSIPLNQRATNRWVAQPGVDVLSPATASNCYICETPTMTGVAITSTVIVREH